MVGPFSYTKFGITFVVVHFIQVETIVCIVSKIWISGRKQLVKDYKIFFRYRISIVVEKKGLTKLFKTRNNGLVLWLQKLLQDLRIEASESNSGA